MRRSSISLWLGVSLSLCFTFVQTVVAQQPESQEGFAINRFDPAEHGSDWFTSESLDLRGDPRFALGLNLEWGYKPLVLYDSDGEEREAIIEHQLFGHLGGGVIFLDRLRGSINLPIALFQDGEAGSTEDARFESSNDTTIGNIRLSLDVRILGEYRDPITFAGGVQLHLPTGSQQAYTSDGSTRIVPRLMLAGRLSIFEYAARIGMNIRTQERVFDDKALGSEILFGAAAGVRIADGKLLLGPEIFGSTVVTDKDAFFARETTPLELLLGGHYSFHPDWKAGLGASFGLTPGFGSPAVRLVASLAWLPEPEKPEAPKDTDGDGIIDNEDACPEEPGIATDDPSTNGCPAPLDTDGDGIIDDEDACPEEPGIATDDPSTNGCPAPLDTDGDGIIDDEDACPQAAGPPNSDPAKNGCPKAVMTEKQIRILEKVNFATAKSKILEESFPVLDEVAEILKQHPEIIELSVEGHTDNRGRKNYNQRLSQRRANAVKKYLVDKGIDSTRLVAKGYGLTRPIASNYTEEGRAENRRVEFNIMEQDGKPLSD
jgi:OOP family OmpA-OmpF porin